MSQALRNLLLCTPFLLLMTGCDEADPEKNELSGRFTTATRPAPNPQREALETLIRKDLNVPTDLKGAPKFKPYSEYNGEDIRQVTGVSGRSLLLVFTAPWCKHSNAMKKALKELTEKEKGNVQVVDVNADAFPVLAEEFGIAKVPTTFLYTEGVRLRAFEGAMSSQGIQNLIRNVLTRGED